MFLLDIFWITVRTQTWWKGRVSFLLLPGFWPTITVTVWTFRRFLLWLLLFRGPAFLFRFMLLDIIWVRTWLHLFLFLRLRFLSFVAFSSLLRFRLLLNMIRFIIWIFLLFRPIFLFFFLSRWIFLEDSLTSFRHKNVSLLRRLTF